MHVSPSNSALTHCTTYTNPPTRHSKLLASTGGNSLQQKAQQIFIYFVQCVSAELDGETCIAWRAILCRSYQNKATWLVLHVGVPCRWLIVHNARRVLLHAHQIKCPFHCWKAKYSLIKLNTHDCYSMQKIKSTNRILQNQLFNVVSQHH